MKKVYLVGGIPHPVGGVTTHVWRLANRLHEQGYLGGVVDLYASEKKYRFNGERKEFSGTKICMLIKSMLYLARLRGQIVHLHISGAAQFSHAGLFLLFASRRNTNILTIHDGNPAKSFGQLSLIGKFMYKLALRHIDCFIVLSPDIRKFLEEHSSHPRVVEASSYIAISSLEKKMYESRNSDVEQFRIISTGSLKKVYNMPEVIEAVSYMRQKLDNKKIVLDLCLYGDADQDVQSEFKKMLENSDFVTIHYDLDQEDFLQMLSSCQLLVRATSHDSYGLSVAEAISLGVPVIASDVCRRHIGTVLFPKDDFATMRQVMCDIVLNYQTFEAEITNVEPEDSLSIYVSTYEGLM